MRSLTDEQTPATGFLPVLTFSAENPLDAWVAPHLSDCGVDGYMVSVHYASLAGREQLARYRLPYMIDSGAYLAIKHQRSTKVFSETILVDGASLPMHSIQIDAEDLHATLSPERILEQQLDLGARWAISLDLPCAGPHEDSRLQMTIDNARVAASLFKRWNSSIFIYGAVQGWDVESYRICARQMRTTGVHGIAISGLVRFCRQPDLLREIVSACSSAAGVLPLHILGIDSPDTLETIVQKGSGVLSADSSSYIRNGLDIEGPLLVRRNAALRAYTAAADSFAGLHTRGSV